MSVLDSLSGSYDYMTPPWLCEIIRRHAVDVGQPITLDPCTSDIFNRNGLRAPCAIGLPDDGLAISWEGESVFVNPPGGKAKPGAKAWWEKLVTSQCVNGYYLSFTLASLQWSQSSVPISDFQSVVFARRLRFWEPVSQAAAALGRGHPSRARVARIAEAAVDHRDTIETEAPVSACMLTWLSHDRAGGLHLRDLIRAHEGCELLCS